MWLILIQAGRGVPERQKPDFRGNDFNDLQGKSNHFNIPPAETLRTGCDCASASPVAVPSSCCDSADQERAPAGCRGETDHQERWDNLPTLHNQTPDFSDVQELAVKLLRRDGRVDPLFASVLRHMDTAIANGMTRDVINGLAALALGMPRTLPKIASS